MHFSATSALYLTLGVVSAIPRQHQAARACYEDNPLRALEQLSSLASTFCPQYLTSAGVAVPGPLTQWQGARLSSACNCFEKTAAPTKPTSTTSKISTTTTTPTETPTTTTSSTTTTSPTTTKTSTSSSSSTTATKPASTSTAPVKNDTPAGAKRGLVYDYSSQNSYFNFFTGSQYISFGSDWGATRATNGVSLPNKWTFVPTLAVNSQLQNNDWSNNVNTAIKSGTKWIFASNEPDNGGQANLSPADTAKVYKQYIQPFQGQALLATPAVTNGGGSSGLNFLGQFLGNCTSCHFDLINIHHYLQLSDFQSVAQAASALKGYIEQNVPALQAQHSNIQNIPIVIGEYGLVGASLDNVGTYLQDTMPYLDCKSNIIGYQAFGGLWPGNFITSDGKGLTPAGTAYNSYSKAC